MKITGRRPLPTGDGVAPPVSARAPRWRRRLALAGLFVLCASVHGGAQDDPAARVPREFTLYRIRSASMAPVLRPGDMILVDVEAPVRPERGDIVVYRLGDVLYVHRAVGMPGDRVQYVEGRLRLNGAEVPRQRIGPAPDLDGVTTDRGGTLYRQRLDDRSFDIIEVSDREFLDDTQPVELADDEIMVLGDNRDNAADSRIAHVGPISLDQLVGIARFRVWPPDRRGPIDQTAR